jgi:hypothetical protein
MARLYAAEAGESHFGTGEWHAAEIEFAAGAGLGGHRAGPGRAGAHAADPGRVVRQIVPGAAAELMVVVAGSTETTGSDGETRLFTPGSAILLEFCLLKSKIECAFYAACNARTSLGRLHSHHAA